MGTLAPTRGRLPVQPSKTTRTGTSGKIVHHCVRAMFIGHFAVGFAAKRSAGAWPQRQDGSRPVESGGGNGGHRGRHARGRGNLVRRRDKICDARRQPGTLGVSRAAGLFVRGSGTRRPAAECDRAGLERAFRLAGGVVGRVVRRQSRPQTGGDPMDGSERGPRTGQATRRRETVCRSCAIQTAASMPR
jgi:hypothetical protein